MSWPLVAFGDPRTNTAPQKPGHWWYCSWLKKVDGKVPSFLSKFYLETGIQKRDPVCIVLPGGGHWIIDQKSSNGQGWKVEGEEGKWTVTPSIATDNYHGHLTNGVLTDDTEGRKYEDDEE